VKVEQDVLLEPFQFWRDAVVVHRAFLSVENQFVEELPGQLARLPFRWWSPPDDRMA